MFAFAKYVYNNYLSNHKEESEVDEEDFVAQKLLQLEIENCDLSSSHDEEINNAGNSDCLERTGTVTYLEDEHGLIDEIIYFDRDCTMLSLRLKDRVRYLGYRNSEQDTIRVVKILQTLAPLWEDELEQCEEKGYKTKEHVIIGQVHCRNERKVAMKDSDVKFSLDNVESSIVPLQGDWLELTCQIQWDEESPCDVQGNNVLEVIAVRPLRTKVANTKITQWNGNSGVCDKQIYFNKESCQNGFEPFVGTKVLVEIMESDQGSCTWRAITLVPEDTFSENNNQNKTLEVDEEEVSYVVEAEKNLNITKPMIFKNVNHSEKQTRILQIINESNNTYTVIKWKLLSSRYDSQLLIEPFLSRKVHLYPNKTIQFTFTCRPKVMGSSREMFVLVFEGFQIKRWININIVHNHTQAEMALGGGDITYTTRSNIELISAMKQMHTRRQSGHSLVAGVRPIRTPNFVPVKLGVFNVPEKLWSAVLGDSDETVYSSEFNKIVDRIESTVPSLCASLNIVNYTDRWHALLYIEEIQQSTQMRVYDMQKVFLTPSQGCLTLQIDGLSERRPSLIRGDRVIVKDIWNSNVPDYEGFIHDIKGDYIFMKFNSQFQDQYSGCDVAIEFHFSRSVYRRCHQAINLAISHLGPDILFPSRILKRDSQVVDSKIENVNWCNTLLNQGQKEAVKNILIGTCRPMPYCIFGPPGTGKTMTVVETILQILLLIPDSRILVTTPSNSSANLLTERLLNYKDNISGSLIRLIAHYLVDSETLPDRIKPFCATLDIATENTARSNYMRNNDGINLSCRSKFIGRHKVTIGTCACLGTLAQMALPRGHFTHVIVDEAGQATEPEIMIPLTFIDKESGQIILAGDPLQLGPVVLSKYAQEFGFDQSYLVRLLERVPYQKDFESFKDAGYDSRLITRLTYNYRSVAEVITLPSEMFYDGCLVPQVSGNEEWVMALLNSMHDLLPRQASVSRRGGIFMYGVKGVNVRAADSPSWYNPQEATMVLLFACKLYKRNVLPDQIGIITPYIAQVKYLRKLFDTTGTPQPKIGSVEEFQGQERQIVLLSTVRSSETLLEDDYKYALGFVKSPKRLNVALSRAQVAAVLFGDPHLLIRDQLWGNVIKHTVTKGQYTGCDLPACLVEIT